MKKIPLLLFFFTAAFLHSQGQSVLHGKIVDTTSGEGLSNAVVCLLQSKDSILRNFTRVKPDGSFSITNADTGKYILFVSYPEYADFVRQTDITEKNKDIDLGTIKLIQAAHLLQDVIVTQKLGAIRIKGDTTEFVADSFKTQPNANVEDLLKKLPGIQVDQNGKITAQGQTVPKVLVDGEEFFGDDPTLVTRNLRADMVDKVQVYDKQSDQAAFTGIDDGNKTKTINIKLKENKKNGYFGKASGGIGTDKYKETQDMFNYFKGKQKISAYLTLANTGKTGLGFEDEMKYGSMSGGMDVMDGGMIVLGGGSNSNDPLQSVESWDGNYDGNGIPDAKTGGVHFDNKWNDDKQDINLNYKIGSISEKGSGQTITQTNLPTGILYDSSNNNFYKDVFRQKLDGMYDWQFDSSSSVKITVGGSLAHSTSDNYTTNMNTRSSRDSLVNDGWNNNTASGNAQAFNGSILWRKKFKKKRRTMSFNLNEYLKNQNSSGYLNSFNNFYNDQNIVDSTSSVDQRKINKSKSNSLDAKLTYTEPLGKWSSIVADYGLDIENSTSDIRSYNKNADSSYDILDSLYSNHYIYNQLTNSGGIAFAYVKGKMNFNAGTDIGATHYHQTNTFTLQKLDRSFINWAPKVNLLYKIASQRTLRFSYNGSTQQPSVSQIQPVLDNSDVLNIYVGNPDLKPSFNNQFSLHYFDFKVLSQRNIFINGSYNFTTNPIVTDVSTNDTTGKSIYNYFNLGSASSNYNMDVDYGRKWKKLDLNYDIDLSFNGAKQMNSVNGIINTNTSTSYNLWGRLYKSKEKKYEISLNGSVTYTDNNSTLQNQINNNYWSYNLNPYVDIYLPAKFEINTNGNYTWNQKTQTLPEYHQFIWNAWVGRKFFKKENLLVKFSVNDLLNQNNGYSRSAGYNTYMQSLHTTIKRYFMLSVVWDFTKMAGAVNANK